MTAWLQNRHSDEFELKEDECQMGNQVKCLTKTLVKDRRHFSLKTANKVIVVLDVF